MRVVFFWLYFLKERNQLLTGKMKLKEKYKSAQNNILELTALQNARLLSNDNPKNKLVLTMQNIDFTKATTEQLRAKKRNSGQNYSKK